MKLSSSLFQYYTIPELKQLRDIYEKATLDYKIDPRGDRPDPILQRHLMRMDEISMVLSQKYRESKS